jgi:hypothetical protein
MHNGKKKKLHVQEFLNHILRDKQIGCGLQLIPAPLQQVCHHMASHYGALSNTNWPKYVTA